jgi:elongation factor Ts
MSIEQIKELRDATGLSVMQCKKALEEAEGDMDKARLILSKKSAAAAAKKADREIAAGRVAIASVAGKMAIIQLGCETDYVAKNEDFVTLADKIAAYALENGVDTLKENSASMIEPVIQKIGENIKLGSASILEGSTLGSYIHNGAIAVGVQLEGGSEEIAKDVAMHISAMKPLYTTRQDVPAEAMEATKAMFAEEVASEDKPEEIKAKILEGKINSYFKAITLMDQGFIKDQNKTIGQLLSEGGATLKNFVMEKI